MKRMLFALISVSCTAAFAACTAAETRIVVAVRTQAIGAGAAVVETDVTAPLERALLNMHGVSFLRSQSRTGESVIEFQASADRACDALPRLRQAIADIQEGMPATGIAPSISAHPEIRC